MEDGIYRAPWFFYRGLGHSDEECLVFPCHPQARCHTNLPMLVTSNRHGLLFLATASGARAARVPGMQSPSHSRAMPTL